MVEPFGVALRLRRLVEEVARLPAPHRSSVQACVERLQSVLAALEASARVAESRLAEVDAMQQALRESEERYRRLLACATDYVYEVTVEGGQPVATVHGPGSLPVTGFAAEEYAANRYLWHVMVHEEDRPAVEEQARRVLAGEPVAPLEHRIVHKDGSLRWLRNAPVARFDGAGRVVAYDGLITDITERRLAEEALRDSEAKYRTLFRTATDAIFVENLDGAILECNAKALELFGYSENELLQLSVADLVPPEVQARLPEITALHRQGKGLAIEAVNRKKNGALFPCEVHSQVTNIGGQPRVIVSVRDITERREAEAARLREREAEGRAKAAEAARRELQGEVDRRREVERQLQQRTAELAESEAKFRTLAEQSPNMILINRAGRIVYANQACERILGFKCSDLESPTFDRMTLFAPEHVAAAAANFDRHLSGDEVPPSEYSLVASDNHRVDVILATRIIEFEGERAVLGLATDITERKREEEKLRQLQREITDLPAKEQRRIGQELHDNLGQQLTGVGMLVKSLAQKLAALGIPEASEAEQIFTLVQQAHAETRSLSRGLLPVEVDTEGLMSALEQLAESCRRLPGLRCRFLCRRPVEVEDNTVATQLYRIAQEAVSNAVLHGRPQQVTIALKTLEDRTVLEVTDNGRGFPLDPKQATGMGLRIMRYRAATIGAELEIESRRGGGTRVTCTLPDGRRQAT